MKVLAFSVAVLMLSLPGTESRLFLQDDPLQLVLLADLKSLCRKPDQSRCQDVPATLVYHAPGSEDQHFSVMLRTRGIWRLSPANCSIPPLFLLFGNDTGGTLFAGQDLLPLVTHCRSKREYFEDYVLKEYLAYRIYNLLTEASVRVRLVQIVYKKPSGKVYLDAHYGFLAEHFRFMADRNGAEMWETEDFDLEDVDPMEMATMELFQFMIGHTDWSALVPHNIVLMSGKKDAVVTAIPFDFDFSGLVSARYALPPIELPIRNTRQRLYRGFCNPGIDWEALFARFQNIRAEVFRLVENLPLHSGKVRRRTREYLEDFYEILDSPRSRESRIIKACRKG